MNSSQPSSVRAQINDAGARRVQYTKFGLAAKFGFAVIAVVVNGITASPPINITAVAIKNIANAVLFALVFSMKLGDIVMIYPFVNRDKRKTLKKKAKKRHFLFAICVALNKITIQGGSKYFFLFRHLIIVAVGGSTILFYPLNFRNAFLQIFVMMKQN